VCCADLVHVRLVPQALGSPEIAREDMQAARDNHVQVNVRGELFTKVQEAATYSDTAIELFKFDHAVMGGTFDHMHLGHRLLLSQAAIFTKDTLVIGITAASLLSKKQYGELIEPFEDRKSAVEKFLKAFNPRLKVICEEISDPVGPAGTISELEACILTRESEKGGYLINE
jgi:phosphopantetheine adenylyltransferase